MFGYLPNRQLRKIERLLYAEITCYLPNRQLRNSSMRGYFVAVCYLPNRQLRNFRNEMNVRF